MFALLVLRTGREGLQDDTTGRLADLGAQVSVRAPIKEENQRATAGGGQQEKEMKARRMQAPVVSSAKTAKQGRGAGANSGCEHPVSNITHPSPKSFPSPASLSSLGLARPLSILFALGHRTFPACSMKR